MYYASNFLISYLYGYMYEKIIKLMRISTIIPLSIAEIEKTFSNFFY